MQTLTIHRLGDFAIRTEGQFHCGTNDILPMSYELTCKCNASDLDERGFLFDQVHIDQWFQAQTSTSLSCESYGIYCARELYKLIVAENPKCKPMYICMKLSPAPYKAVLEYEWSADSHHHTEPSYITKPEALRPVQPGLFVNAGGAL